MPEKAAKSANTQQQKNPLKALFQAVRFWRRRFEYSKAPGKTSSSPIKIKSLVNPPSGQRSECSCASGIPTLWKRFVERPNRSPTDLIDQLIKGHINIPTLL